MPQGKGFHEHDRNGKQRQLTEVDLDIKAIEGRLKDPRRDERSVKKLVEERDALIRQRNDLVRKIDKINKILRRNG